MSEIIVIAAISENYCIGKDNTIPWHIKEDLQRFRKLTLNYPVIMGRKTYDSLPKKPLEKRINIILTKQDNFNQDGIVVKKTLEDAILFCKDYKSIYFIGGESIYKQAMPLADRLEITKVHQVIDGDAFFPAIDNNQWKIQDKDSKDGYSFLTYVRKK